LESYHLSTSGNSLDVLRDRYRHFRLLYNAECHRQSTKLLAPVARLVDEVHADEAARNRERRQAMMNGSYADAERMKNLYAKWDRDGSVNADADPNTSTNDDGGRKCRADDIPDKMKSMFAELVAELTKRYKEEGWRMEQKRWGEEDHERAIQKEKKDGGGEGEDPIVLDDDDDDEEDERKPSATVAAALEEAAEDAAIDEPLDSARAHAEAGAASSPDGGDGEAEAQISRFPSSESPRTVRASSSSDGLVGSASASSTSASASESSSAKRSKPSPQQPSQRHSPPSHQQQHQQQSSPEESAGHQRGSVDTRSTRNNTPSTIGPWSCPQCTYHNEINIGSRDKCEVCDGPRPTNRRPSRNVATFDC